MHSIRISDRITDRISPVLEIRMKREDRHSDHRHPPDRQTHPRAETEPLGLAARAPSTPRVSAVRVGA